MSARGGYSRAQLALLGVPFPLPKGWKKRLIGTSASRAKVDRFISMKDSHLSASRKKKSARRANAIAAAGHRQLDAEFDAICGIRA